MLTSMHDVCMLLLLLLICYISLSLHVNVMHQHQWGKLVYSKCTYLVGFKKTAFFEFWFRGSKKSGIRKDFAEKQTVHLGPKIVFFLFLKLAEDSFTLVSGSL
jgi:hypothetical protein